MSKPLEGVKVLEMSAFVAAPSCARLLADMGAIVIKVEHPAGDGWRKLSVSYLPGRFSEDENPVFDIYNTGKKLISLNIKTPGGMEAFHKLLAESDVFITNTRPKSLKKLGLSYEELKEKYPRLIYAAVLGYGEKGPDAEKPAFDTTAFWSRSGFLRDLSIAGDNYMPVMPPWSAGDTLTGMLLMGEICSALYHREKTGKGDYVRSGLYHNGIFTMGTMAILSQRPFGYQYPMDRPSHGIPGGYYRTSDNEWIYLSLGDKERQLPVLYKALGREDLGEDPRYETEAGRWDNRYEYYQEIKETILKKSCAQWLEIAEEFDLPLTRMAQFADVTEDEQAWANDYLEHVDFPSGNTDVMPRSPIEMDSVGLLKTVPAQGIGADTEEILKNLGYSAEEISAMRDNGAVK